MIQFESVGKTLRRGTAGVTDLSLTFPSAQTTVVVGPAGSGTTTVLRLVNRMVEPTSGQIVWDGNPLRTKRKTAVRRRMGYLTHGGLFPHRTVLDNIGTVPGLLAWKRSRADQRGRELLGLVGLDRHLAHRYPAELTSAQQLRVGLARALAAKPDVVLLDEPFANLDPTARAEAVTFFAPLLRELGTTTIMATDAVDEALRLGDRVAVLRPGGTLAQVGTPQQLLDEPADAYVDGFLGRDRGYRSLSYHSAGQLGLDRVQVVRDPGAAGPEPTLVVDADARPIGWADPARPGQVFPLGATFSPDQDLRVALDAALTSPFGLAVGVEPATGRFAGVVSATTILSQVTEARAARAESVALGENGSAAATLEPNEEPAAPVDPGPAVTEIETEDGSTIVTDLPAEAPPLPEETSGPPGAHLDAADESLDAADESLNAADVTRDPAETLDAADEHQLLDVEFDRERQLEVADARR